MRIMKNNENNYTNVSPSVSSSRNIPVAMSQRGWKVSFAILLGSARPVPCAKWCCGVPVLSKIPLQLLHLRAKDCCPPPDWTLLVDLLMVVRTQAEWSNQHWRCAHIVYRFGKFRKFWFYATNLQISLHHIQLQSRSSARITLGHQVVISDTANEFSTKLQREWSDQIALKMCTTRFPKIGRYGQHKIQRCVVHVNKKQTIPKIWNYWITSTMSWHWNANFNIENPSVASF